jgi:glycosyltransferase involved in cell wall biosynthesis
MASDRRSEQPDAGRRRSEPPDAGRRLRLMLVVPFPPRRDSRHGGKVIAQLLDRLLDEYDVGLLHLTSSEAPPPDRDLCSRASWVRPVMDRPGAGSGPAWRRRLQVVAGPLSGLPSPVAAVHHHTLPAIARELVRSWRPDVIQVEHDVLAYCGPALVGVGAPRILVCHDPGRKAAADLVARTTGRQRRAHQLDEAVWRRYERRNLPSFDALVAFSPEDAQELQRARPGARVVEIPLGIELPAEPAPPSEPDGPVLFFGGYSHHPNADAALRLARAIMPSVRVGHPTARLVLAGDQPTPEMRAAAGPLDQVTGRVASMEPYLSEAAVVALPIRIGGGMRVKLLEALAAGKAVVASRVAAAGLQLRPGHELEIAEDDEAFAAAIVALLDDPARRVALGRAARAHAEAHLRWEVRAADYGRLYRELIAARGTQR